MSTATDVQIIGALVRKADRNLKRAGVKSQSRVRGGVVEHRFLFPLKKRPGSYMAIGHKQAVPTIIGGKVGQKIKKATKQAVKSKAFGKVLKAASVISAVVPGGQAAAAGLAAAATAQQMLSKAAAKGKKAVQAVKGAVKAGKQIKAAVKGKPAAALKAAAVKTMSKSAKMPALQRPGASLPGIPVQLPNGKRALVTFI